MSSSVARGPLKILLATPAGQYAVLGLGAFSFFPEQTKQVLATLKPLLLQAGFPKSGFSSDRSSGEQKEQQQSQQAPIVIHTPSPTIYTSSSSKGGKGLVGIIVVTALGAGACWIGYACCAEFLSDTVGQVLPVTRKVFDATAKALGTGILTVKQALEEQMGIVTEKQEALARKQDETHERVTDIQSELGDARIDLATLNESMCRLEESFENSQGMQGYTLRGVKLLVRCVASFLPRDSSDTYMQDLARFIDDEKQELIRDANDNDNANDNTKNKNDNKTPPRQQWTLERSISSCSASSTAGIITPMVRPSNKAARSVQVDRLVPDGDASFRDIHAILGHTPY